MLDPYNRSASPAKKITSFTLVKTELPKTRLGKIRRFQLPEFIKQHATKERPHETVPDYPEYAKIAAFIKDQTGKTAHPEDHLEIDLGMDSLDKVSLMTFLETTFGVVLQDDEMLQHVTVGKIAEYVREKKIKMAEDSVNWHQLLHENVSFDLPSSAMLPVSAPVLKFGLRRSFRLSVTGLEQLPNSPMIFAANHQSYLDGMLIGSFLSTPLLKRTYFYADEQHFRKRWQQLFAAKNNIIIMDMNRELKLSLQKMAEVLRRGNNVIIFPEGSRTRDGALAEFKKTFAILSRELNVPVVPVALQGAYEAMPIGQKMPKFGQPIRVTFLPPMYPETLEYEALSQKVERAIREQLEKI